MLFHIFSSQEERRGFGGSAFVEIQFCKLPHGTAAEQLVAVDRINPWQDDSLYINDESVFYREYSSIFDGGICNHLKRGTVDLYGINYYAPALTDSIVKRLRREKPADYEVLLEWLLKSEKYNGFYILGL